MQSRGIIPRGIDKNPKARRSSHQERLPPPVVVLGTQLDVGGDDDRLGNRDGEEGRDDAEEAEDVIIRGFVQVDGLEDKDQFDEQNRKRDETGAEREGNLVSRIPCLGGNLSRDGIGPRRMLPDRRPVEAVVGTEMHERELDQEPETRECQQGREGERGRGRLSPGEEV